MKRFLIPSALALVALLASSSAQAQRRYYRDGGGYGYDYDSGPVRGYFVLDVGALYGMPTYGGDYQLGGGGALEGGVMLFNHLQLGLRLRGFGVSDRECGVAYDGYGYCSDSIDSWAGSLALQARYLFRTFPHVRFAVGVSAGYGLWSWAGACAPGQSCASAGGMNLAADFRIIVYLWGHFGIHAAFEPQFQFGMVNGADALFMPTFYLGLDF